MQVFVKSWRSWVNRKAESWCVSDRRASSITCIGVYLHQVMMIMMITANWSRLNGCLWIIMCIMCTKNTVKSFLNVSTEDFEAGIKRKNGLKDVSGIYLYKHVIVLFIVDTKASEKLTPLLLNSNHLKDITRLSSIVIRHLQWSHFTILLFILHQSIAFSYMGMKSR